MTTVGCGGAVPEFKIAVLEPGARAPRGWVPFEYKRHFKFSFEALRSYVRADWEDVVFDAMVVCAVIEYADAVAPRPRTGWERRLHLRVPVHEPRRWNEREVIESLTAALRLLTGDHWSFRFSAKPQAKPELRRKFLALPGKPKACMAYSAGLDSWTVSGIERNGPDGELLLVRVQRGASLRQFRGKPFMRVPYWISHGSEARETSGRTRGFKFALISGLAAYLTKSPRILLPESGQGAFGPVLATVGHEYPDYRCHPLFASRMEVVLRRLLGFEVQYQIPRLWSTKGGTLRDYLRMGGDSRWMLTRSCWRNSRWSSVVGKRRQCGVCAACMLRRLSVHAAGKEEAGDAYVCVDMDADSLDKAVDRQFSRLNKAFREYAIAGVRHMKLMADLATSEGHPAIASHAAVLGRTLGMEARETERLLRHLFGEHREEWTTYLKSVNRSSFVRAWGALDWHS